MRLVKWNPSRTNFYPVRREGGFFTAPFLNVFEDLFGAGTVGSLNAEIVEKEGNYQLIAEIPGVNPEDVKVSVEKDVLTIEAEKHNSLESEKDVIYHTERSYGKFSRSFNLNGLADTDKIEAEYKNGVLTLSLPKREEVKGREVKIKVS
jgi:HSP20 family protein